MVVVGLFHILHVRLQRGFRLVLGIHVDRSSLSTNHELASQTCDDEVCEANLWLVERELRSTCIFYVYFMVVENLQGKCSMGHIPNDTNLYLPSL